MISRGIYIRLRKVRGILPFHSFQTVFQDGGQFFDKMWPVSGVLELLQDSHDNIIINPLKVDLLVRIPLRGARWSVFVAIRRLLLLIGSGGIPAPMRRGRRGKGRGG